MNIIKFCIERKIAFKQFVCLTIMLPLEHYKLQTELMCTEPDLFPTMLACLRAIILCLCRVGNLGTISSFLQQFRKYGCTISLSQFLVRGLNNSSRQQPEMQYPESHQGRKCLRRLQALIRSLREETSIIEERVEGGIIEERVEGGMIKERVE